MATSVGTIRVNVTADTTGLSRNLKHARTRFQQFTRSVSKTLAPLKRFGSILGGFTAAGGIATVAMGIRKAADEIDSLAKTSAKLGIATENLAGLHHAAKITGVETRTMNMALQRMTRRMSEAAIDTGEAKDAIKELGLNAAELNRLAPDQQFSRIAEAMAKVTNQTDRVRLAFKLFDSEGVAVLNTLQLGSQGLREMQKEAEQLGLAVTKEGAEKVTKFNDAITKLKATMGGAFRGFTIDISPAATKAVDYLRDVWVGIGVGKTEVKRKKEAGDLGYFGGAAAMGKAALSGITWLPREAYSQYSKSLRKDIDRLIQPQGSSGIRIPDAKKQPHIMRPLRTQEAINKQLIEEGKAREKARKQQLKDDVLRRLNRKGPTQYEQNMARYMERAKVWHQQDIFIKESRENVKNFKEAWGKTADMWRKVGKDMSPIKDKILSGIESGFTGSAKAFVDGTKAAWREQQPLNIAQNVRDNLPQLMTRFGIDDAIQRARQQSMGMRGGDNRPLERGTMEAYVALRQNLGQRQQEDMKTLLERQLRAIEGEGDNGTNGLLKQVLDAVRDAFGLNPPQEIGGEPA